MKQPKTATNPRGAGRHKTGAKVNIFLSGVDPQVAEFCEQLRCDRVLNDKVITFLTKLSREDKGMTKLTAYYVTNSGYDTVLIETKYSLVAYTDQLFLDCFSSAEPDFSNWAGGAETDLEVSDFGYILETKTY